jgi:riboflavin kinase/FMN adenylyltransferase
MKTVFLSPEEARNSFGPCALTIGNFDGVHKGHRTLIQQARQIAQSHGWTTGVLTFDPHPTAIVAPERTPQMICSLQERLRLLEKAGADRVLILPFTKEVAAMSAREFIEEIVIGSLDARAILVGQNFRFGRKQSGNAQVLAELGQELGFEAHFLAPITFRGEVVSSTAIRQHLRAGNVSRAGRLLGRCFSLQGEIVKGRGVGSKQTVPTLNLQPGSEVIPAAGVYITEAIDLEDGRQWNSITNVGVRPTFGAGDLSIESFLLSPFDGRNPDRIELRFFRWVREERTFPDPQALKSQILKDVGAAQKYWRRLHHFREINAARL